MNTLVIEKQTGGYFKFTLNGDTANAITSIQNDLLAVGTQLHFKTGNGANIIKEQFIYPADVTIIASGTFTFSTVAQVWDKLIEIDYFAWLGGGGTGGVDRFDDLLDTFSYTGNAGKAVVVDGSELRLVPITLYNKRLFTELEDTPSSLVPNKMLVVNPAGTAVVLQDQPEQPEQLLNSVGYFDYNDLITQTTPLNAVANVALKLTNDTEGANTSTDQNPYGVSYVWDYTTNQFNFNELEVGDTIDVRIHVHITTTTSNQKVVLSSKLGIGSPSEFTNSIYENQFKSSGLHEISVVAPFYMGSTDITDNPAELYLTTDASATVKVGGWYVRILRKNINIITVDYTVPDATTTVKGIVRLAGDLSGTANSPTVPELANKVPNTRTVSTTSPLLGGGALSSNLTLSIQQANSVDSGYLSNVDWSTFNGKANDNAVVKLTGDQSITGSKSFTTNTAAPAMVVTNNSTDNGILLQNTSTGNALRINNGALSTGDLIRAGKDGNVTFIVNQNGNTTAASFIKSGGTSSQFLKADGSIDSSTYALTSQLHDAVTIGTANGLSLSGQVLSLALASPTTRGALTSEDYNYFFDKVQGNGNQNYIPKYIFSGSNKVIGNSLIYDNGTNVGIGTTSPSAKLHVTDTSAGAIVNNITIQNASNTSSTEAGIFFAPTTATGNIRGARISGIQEDGNNAIGLKFYTGLGATISERMRITSGGQVGIGTSSPNRALTIVGGNNEQIAITSTTTKCGISLNPSNTTYSPYIGATANDVIVETSGSERMRITSGGNVGIGTNSPSQKLTIGDGTATGNQYLRINSSATDIYIGQSGSGLFGLAANSGGNIASDNTSFPLAIGTISSQSLIFGTTNTERMRITSGGNVGIGTTSPLSKLHIQGDDSSTTDETVLTLRGNGENGKRIDFRNAFGSLARITGTKLAGGASADEGILTFETATDSVLSEKMRITSGGNVGIGTTSPTSALQVGAGTVSSIPSWVKILSTGSSDTGIASAINNKAIYLYNNGSTLKLDAYDYSASAALDVQIGGNGGKILLSGGNVGIGTTSPAEKLEVQNGTSGAKIKVSNTGGGYAMLECSSNATSTATLSFTNSISITGGNATFSNNVTATGFFNSSDNRLKDLIDYDYNVLDIKPITYLWKDGRDNKKHVGYSAQEVQKVMPDAVNEGTDGMLSVNYVEILVAKISQMEKEIAYLKSKI